MMNNRNPKIQTNDNNFPYKSRGKYLYFAYLPTSFGTVTPKIIGSVRDIGRAACGYTAANFLQYLNLIF